MTACGDVGASGPGVYDAGTEASVEDGGPGSVVSVDAGGLGFDARAGICCVYQGITYGCNGNDPPVYGCSGGPYPGPDPACWPAFIGETTGGDPDGGGHLVPCLM